MEIKLNARKEIKLESLAEKCTAAAVPAARAEHASEVAVQKKEDKRKRIVVLRCGTVMLQNFTEDLNEPGRQLKLVREPDNAHDRWATKVYTLEETMLGYLPVRKNQSVARLMDAGKTITVFVDEELQFPTQNPDYESGKLPLILYMDVKIPEEEEK